jgi:hypothetical protein
MNFTTENIREHIAALLAEAQELILSPRPEDEARCAALLANACELMQQIAGQREDLPPAFGINHPLRRLPADNGESCPDWDAMDGQAK